MRASRSRRGPAARRTGWPMRWTASSRKPARNRAARPRKTLQCLASPGGAAHLHANYQAASRAVGRIMEQQLGEGRRITLHAAADFEGMRRAGRLAAETLDMITPHVKPGITTEAIDRLIHDFVLAHDAIPATLGY